MKIHIFGASGSGTTTLGKVLSEKLAFRHLDADDYYWVKTNPSFQQKVPKSERNALITNHFYAQENCIISGSMVSWGKEWEQAFDLAVFLYVPSGIRLERLRNREKERYGNLLINDQNFAAQSHAFLEWATKYDDATFPGRSLTIHNEFIKRMACPVLRIEGDTSVEFRLNTIMAKINQ